MTATLLLEDTRIGLCEKCSRLLELSPVVWEPKGGAESTVWLCSRDRLEATGLPDGELAGWLPERPDGWTPFPALDVAAEPVRLQVVRFKCPWCPKSWSKRATTVAHIARCWADPANRTCRTCVHLERAHPAPYSPFEPTDESVDECAIGETLPDAAPVVGCPLWEAVTGRG